MPSSCARKSGRLYCEIACLYPCDHSHRPPFPALIPSRSCCLDLSNDPNPQSKRIIPGNVVAVSSYSLTSSSQSPSSPSSSPSVPLESLPPPENRFYAPPHPTLDTGPMLILKFIRFRHRTGVKGAPLSRFIEKSRQNQWKECQVLQVR